MRNPLRALRLQTKLIASYVVLGTLVTALSLVGGHLVQAQGARERLQRSEILRATWELGALVNSAAEESFSFVLMGDPEEEKRATSKLDAARTSGRDLSSTEALTPDERATLDMVAAGTERLRHAAAGVFDDYRRDGVVSAARYAGYEAEIDGLTDRLAQVRALAHAENARSAARIRRLCDELTMLIGVVSVGLAAAIGIVLSRRATRPLLELRDAALAFGAGRVDVRMPAGFDDEIGQLASAFEEMVGKRQRLEGELRQAQKMEAIGRLAGGVAHDFNNMLSIILGYTSLMLEGRAEDDALHEPLVEVKRAGERSADLTRQLLAFSRQEAIETQVFDVGAVADDTLKMVRRVVGENIEVTATRAFEPCLAEFASGQIEQILMNLVVNARDAMPRGGRLEIDTRLTTLGAADAAEHEPLEPGRYVVLTVRDNGIGMDPQTKERIFEPFFTTKEQGRGTGLGLSTVFGIVHERGGRIEVESELGQGSCFRMILPVAHAGELGPQTQRASVSVQAARTVLLVEDEDQVRGLVQRILRKRGYKVIAARDAREALARSEEYSGPIDLLLSDVMMPGMCGPELADRLLARRPLLKILFMSGYTDAFSPSDLGRGTGRVFLQKPITPDVLGQKIRDMFSIPPDAVARLEKLAS
jgi:signal transduction histidine kinase/CheY-like chemotaxis protein